MSELTANPELDEFLKDLLGDKPEEVIEPSERPMHLNHPTDPTVTWCGVPKEQPGYRNHRAGHPRKTNCPACLALRQQVPRGWWWHTHCRYYESDCHTHNRHSFHNCSAHIV